MCTQYRVKHSSEAEAEAGDVSMRIQLTVITVNGLNEHKKKLILKEKAESLNKQCHKW